MEMYQEQRLSLKGQLCTVRYIGPVTGKSGEWLGVEWDDPSRGKHNGTHDGVPYFKCRSNQPTCASFLRPNQPWDKSKTFLEALREKYVANEVPSEQEAIQISKSKQAEEVGFSKFAARQAELRGIHNVVLDHMCIRHQLQDSAGEDIEGVCKDITDLDVGSNLFEDVLDVFGLVMRLPKLRSLTLNGNRFLSYGPTALEKAHEDDRIRYLSLSRTLLAPLEVRSLLRMVFSRVETLLIGGNEWTEFPSTSEVSALGIGLPRTLKTVDLSGNYFTALSDVRGILESPARVDPEGAIEPGSTAFELLGVRSLSLKNCRIKQVQRPELHTDEHPLEVRQSVEDLDLRYNDITDWNFIDDLATLFPQLKHLRMTGNPLYQNLVSANGKPLAAEDGYILTIARLPGLETLNYSKITEKERLNAETYYLNQIAIEVSQATDEAETAAIKAKHPRWSALCSEYGEPAVAKQVQKGEVDPGSLAARLVTVSFHSVTLDWEEELPKSFNIYEVLGVVGKKLNIMSLNLRLMWETGEKDPVGKDGRDLEGPEWWDSSDDETEGAADSAIGGREVEWVEREVELVAGTRALGTYIEGAQARVRVEDMG